MTTSSGRRSAGSTTPTGTAISSAPVRIPLSTLKTWRRNAEGIYQRRRDPLHREYLNGRAERRGSLGHAVDGAARLVLRDGVMAAVAQRLQSGRSVLSHSRQEDGNQFTWPQTLETFKKDVDGRPVHHVTGLWY